jgi:hypothetical protein
MIHQFDHRFATYTGGDEDSTREVTEEQKRDPEYRVRPRYWVLEAEVKARLRDREWDRPWLLGWRDICRATDERTVIASIIPRVGVGNKIPLLFPKGVASPSKVACLVANLCSLTLDYCARQKIGGTTMNYFIFKQLPVLQPWRFDIAHEEFIVKRVQRLTAGAADLAGWHADLASPNRPDDDQVERAVDRAELDALFARLYGLERRELEYVLDPSTRGPSYPSETFRVLKDAELRRFGEYRTKRLVLEAWDRLSL